MSEILKTEALILYAQRWQESSKIVHLYSRDYGYVKVIAKGALRPKSPFRGTLEVLNSVEALIAYKSSRGLQLLTGISLSTPFLHIRDDLPKTAIAYAILELHKRLLNTHEPLPDFYDDTIALLSALDSGGKTPPLPFLWWFLLRLSAVLGFGWALDTCLHCGRDNLSAPVRLDYRRGGPVCQNCVQQSRNTETPLTATGWRYLQSLSGALPGEIGELPSADLGDAATHLTETLLRHITHHSETALELKSLKWYV